MKVEVRCPGCGRGYLVDEQGSLGEFSCPSCSASIPLPAPPRARQAVAGDARPAPAARTREAASAVARPATAPARMQSAAAGPAPVARQHPALPADDDRAAPAEVVCPRCNLHFSPRPHAASSVTQQRPVVLIVEDMPYFQEIAADALSEHAEVRRAGSVREARAELAAGDIDLLVLDLTLDGGDHGVDLLRELSIKPCPILIFTAQDESEMYGDSWDELKELGADDMVLKGMNVGESLLRKVGALLGKDWDEED